MLLYRKSYRTSCELNVFGIIISMENNDKNILIQIHLKDYELIREEILLRLKEKNLLTRYLLLLIGAAIGGLWSAKTHSPDIIFMIVLLVIIPVIALILVFLYNWHDERIIELSCYLEKELRPKISFLLNTEDIFTWENFLKTLRIKSEVILYPNLGRLIFIAPIVISIIGFFLLESPTYLNIWKGLFISMDIIFIGICIYSFKRINAKYLNFSKD